jgi:hypothetical protein
MNSTTNMAAVAAAAATVPLLPLLAQDNIVSPPTPQAQLHGLAGLAQLLPLIITTTSSSERTTIQSMGKPSVTDGMFDSLPDLHSLIALVGEAIKNHQILPARLHAVLLCHSPKRLHCTILSQHLDKCLAIEHRLVLCIWQTLTRQADCW